MSKYSKVYAMLDVVAKSEREFDFSLGSGCLIGLACAEGFLAQQWLDDISTASSESFMASLASQLGITTQQAEDIYTGHLKLFEQYVTANTGTPEYWKQVHQHRARMQDKSFCIAYVHSLIETWEAIDAAQAPSLIHDEMVNEDA